MDGGQRRQKRTFEPPPWEREAFERFQQQRKGTEEVAAPSGVAGGPMRGTPSEGIPGEPASADAAGEPAPAEPTDDRSVTGAEPSAQLERQMVEMVARLGVQEAEGSQQHTTFASTVGIALAAAGLGFIIWALARFIIAGKAGGGLVAIGALLVFVWGAMIAGAGVALWRKYNS